MKHALFILSAMGTFAFATSSASAGPAAPATPLAVQDMDFTAAAADTTLLADRCYGGRISYYPRYPRSYYYAPRYPSRSYFPGGRIGYYGGYRGGYGSFGPRYRGGGFGLYIGF